MTRDEIITVLSAPDKTTPQFDEAIAALFNESSARDIVDFEIGILRGMHIGLEIAKRMVREQ